jgi:hypothetical protein
MSEIVNYKGIPLARVKGRALFATTGAPQTETVKIKQTKTADLDTFSHNKVKYASWGSSNAFPDEAIKIIGKTGVLSSGINYRCRVCHGLGIVPVKVIGYDEALNEQIEVIKDTNLLKFLRGYTCRNYLTGSFRDLIKLGNCFPLLVPNLDGKRIARIDALNARHCRLSEDKKKLIVFGNFENSSSPDTTAVVYDILDETDPMQDLRMRMYKDKKIEKPIAFPRIRNYFSNNDYYAEPDWWSAQEAGWIEIANQIPTFLKNAYKNAMSVMYHVQIPYAYYDKYFPESAYKTTAARHEAIKDYQDKFEESLCGTENAQKTIFTTFALNESGRAEEKVEITKIDSKFAFDEKLSTSAAANGEILFSLMVNPSVVGAGTPGGPYAGNAGSGSDIREAFLVNVVMSYIEKNQVLDPLELMLEINGYQDIDLKYRNIVLTTLDKGKNTEEKLD